MPHHAKAAGWTSEHSRRWFAHCDQCGTRRIVADYYEVYPPLDSEGDEAGWWWACSWCLIDIISQMVEDTLTQLERVLTPCKRVSVCCEREAHPTYSYRIQGTRHDDGLIEHAWCSKCRWRAKFKCSVHGDPWPDPEGECLGQENLDGEGAIV